MTTIGAVIQISICIKFTEAIHLECIKTILLCDLSVLCYYSRVFKTLSSRLNEFCDCKVTDDRRCFSFPSLLRESDAFHVRPNTFSLFHCGVENIGKIACNRIWR